MTNLSPRICVLVPWSLTTLMVWSSTNFAVPTSIATWLRASWLRMTSISRFTTWAIRDETSEMVMSCFTRYAWP